MADTGLEIKGQKFLAWPAPKDPDDEIDYGLDWGADSWLNTDTITGSSWILPAGAGLTEMTNTFTDTTTTVWLSGGNIGKWEITNRITTAAGRTKDKTRVLVIKQT